MSFIRHIPLGYLKKALQLQLFRLLEAEQFPPLVSRRDFIPHQISNPDAQIDGMSRKGHPLLALAQIIRQLRRSRRPNVIRSPPRNEKPKPSGACGSTTINSCSARESDRAS